MASQVAPVVKNLPARAGDTGEMGQSLGWEGPKVSPTVHRVTESDTTEHMGTHIHT